MSDRTCSVATCESPARARGWCGKHYQRWAATGTTDAVEWPITCRIESCSGKYKARGWCDKHYQNYRKHGHPTEFPARRLPTQRHGPRACSTCKIVKDESEFYLRSGRRAGARISSCNACNTIKSRAWNRKNSDIIKARCDANRPKLRESQRRWRQSPQAQEVLRALEARRDPMVRRAKAARRRARMLSVPNERIDFKVVFERDRGDCGICLKPVDPDRYHVDHIVAIARGGSHTYDNVQIAHPACNQRKNAKLMEELHWLDEERQA